MTLSTCCPIARIGTVCVAFIGVFLVMVGWAASTGIARADIKETVTPVKLKTPRIGENLEVDENNRCKKNKHEGCLLFERYTLGHIVFHLPGSKTKAKSCPEAEYVITKIEVTPTPAGGSINNSKGNFNGSFPLTGWIVDNAFPAVNPDTGIIHEASVDVARSQEWVTNLNDHDNSTLATNVIHSFWYRVTVTACAENEDGTHTTWVTDPRGDNEGRN